jgi:prevent-host-death family protein
MAATIGTSEAKAHLSELLERVQKGEDITITRHGVAVARLVAVANKLSPEEILTAFRRIRGMSAVPDRPITAAEIREWIEQRRWASKSSGCGIDAELHLHP